MTFTKGGVDTAMTAVQPSTSGDLPGAFMAAMFYQVLPDTGSNKTLKWSWANGPVVNAPIISITFWKGVDTSSPIRGSGGGQNSNLPYTTNTITAQSGDTIVAWVGGFVGCGEGTIDTWSNVSLLAQVACYSTGYADGAWATGSPSGNTTVAASTGTNFSDGGIVAISLIPAPAAPKIKMRAAGNSGSIKIHGPSGGGGLQTPSIVQICNGGNYGIGSTASCTLPSNLSNGTTLVAIGYDSGAGGTLNISGGSLTWTSVYSYNTANFSWHVWTAPSPGSGSLTVDNTIDTDNYNLIHVMEISGINGLDVSPSNYAAECQAPCAAPSLVTVTDGDLVVLAGFVLVDYNTYSNFTNGFNIFQQSTFDVQGFGDHMTNVDAYLVQSTAGSITTNFDLANYSSYADSIMIAFKAKSSAGNVRFR